MAFNKEHAIIAQNSATAASAIVASLVGPGDNIEDVKAYFDDVRQAIFNGTVALAGAESVVVGMESVPSGAARSTGGATPSGRGSSPATTVVNTGKHAGKTFQAIYDEEPDYVEWLASSSKNDFLKRVAGEFLAQVA